MVEQGNNGTYTEIVYDCMGNKLALMNTTSTLVKAFLALPGGAAVYAPGGLQYYRHADWLGSSRFASTTSRTMYNDLAYTPFGVPYAQAGATGVTDISFAGNNEDTTTSLYDAQFREFGIQGRWPSPDPAGVAAANPANPQSWNRYAYVLNNPLSFIDPSGLYLECAGGEVYDIFEAYVNGEDQGQTVQDLGPCPAGGGGGGGQPAPLLASGPGGGGFGGGGNGLIPPPAPTILQNPKFPQPSGCPADPGLAPHSGGVSINGTAGAGMGFAGGSAATGSLGVVGGQGSPIVGTASGGAMTTAGSYTNGVPSQTPPGAATYGAYAGVSAAATFSNGRPGQLRGPFRGFSVEVGLGAFNFGFQLACSGSVCQVSISPGTGLGIGVLVTTMATNTAVTTKQCQ